MRERKRLESLLSLEGDLARRTDDIATYFDLAGEGENVAADLQRDLDSLRELVDRVETETLLSGPIRRPQCHHDDSSRSRRYRVAGLGGDAAAYVSALGRAAGI